LKCNQRFFGQEHFEAGTPERNWVGALGALKPAMKAYEFAVRDRLPELPNGTGGMVQVKYNGMLSVVTYDESRDGFVAFSPRGRCYYSLPDERKHPVTEYFNQSPLDYREYVFVGETHVVRSGNGRCYMTEFARSMSVIKNPRTRKDVGRIQFAVFDYRERDGLALPAHKYLDRFANLLKVFRFPVGVDSGPVHLPDHLEVAEFSGSCQRIQDFWDEFIKSRGFEGLVMHTFGGDEFKIKFRDTLDVAIIAFRMVPTGAARCSVCGASFDLIRLVGHVRCGRLRMDDWFDSKGRQIKFVNAGDPCPLCAGTTLDAPAVILGAKIALMTSEGGFLDIADGAQISPLSGLLWKIDTLYEGEGYLWVKPRAVIEVAYQDLHVDRLRPIYRYLDGRYEKVGTMRAVCLRPYFRGLREDKSVNPRDLRLEQVSYLVDRIHRIQDLTGA
jgi:hypothetical protein